MEIENAQVDFQVGFAVGVWGLGVSRVGAWWSRPVPSRAGVDDFFQDLLILHSHTDTQTHTDFRFSALYGAVTEATAATARRRQW